MYLEISSCTLLSRLLSCDPRETLFSVDANWAQIGVSAGSTAEIGGVVFSFS